MNRCRLTAHAPDGAPIKTGSAPLVMRGRWADDAWGKDGSVLQEENSKGEAQILKI